MIPSQVFNFFYVFTYCLVVLRFPCVLVLKMTIIESVRAAGTIAWLYRLPVKKSDNFGVFQGNQYDRSVRSTRPYQ